MNRAVEELPNLADLHELAAEFDDKGSFAVSGKLWCPACHMLNRFSVTPIFVAINQEFKSAQSTWVSVDANLSNAVSSEFKFGCVTCATSCLAFIVKTSEGPNIFIHFAENGSMATQHTPENVKFYLEQARRCYSVKAYSATLAMYRNALDGILSCTGYKTGTLSKRLDKLQDDIKEEKAPKWAQSFALPYVRVLKTLATSVPADTHDIDEEKAITDQLVQMIELALAEMLDLAFEKDIREQENLAKLTAISEKKSKKS